jgi:hypothetical protein
MIFCTGLPISKEILERNGYKVVVDGSNMASKYENKNFKCLTSKNFYVKAYNSSYSIIIKLPQIYCSHLDLVYKILGEENKRIW